MREIKFRAWNKDSKKMIEPEWIEIRHDHAIVVDSEGVVHFPNLELMQYTGIKDKNDPCKEVYEGDIIDQHGKITGNIYEMDKRETDLVIEGFGTKTWCATYQKAVARGCTDAE